MKLLKRWYSNISRLLLLLSLSILSSCSENIKWLPKLACNIVMSEFGQEYFFNRSNLDRLEYHHFQNEEAIHAFFKEDERLILHEDLDFTFDGQNTLLFTVFIGSSDSDLQVGLDLYGVPHSLGFVFYVGSVDDIVVHFDFFIISQEEYSKRNNILFVNEFLSKGERNLH